MPTVTVPTDYSTIQAACDALSPLVSISNPGTVYVLNGEYEELGRYDLGLYIRNYISIVGQSKAGVIIYPPSGVTAAHAIFYPGYCATHENLTIYARTDNNYALHQDHTSPWVTWKNCRFHHENSGKSAIGGGGRGNQIVTFDSCEVTNGLANVHGDVYARTVSNLPWAWRFINCTMPVFTIQDFIEYKHNVVEFTKCTVPVLTYSQNLTYYNLYPGDPLFNRGYVRPGIFVENYGGNIVDLSDYEADVFRFWESSLLGLRWSLG